MARSAGTLRRPLNGGAGHALRRSRLGVLGLLLALLWGAGAPAAEVLHLTVKGAIGPATAEYLQQGLTEAEASGAALLVLTLDTPGGLDGAMRTMIQAMLASPVPVAVYVAPRGARAASAGTYLLYASHVAAMAPATNLGAATPVQLGGLGGESGGKDDAMAHKLVNDAVAYIRGLAALRGRNADWAEKAVREASSLDAAAALEAGVIDVVAGDLGDLLRQVDGRQVSVGDRTVTLRTAGAVVRERAPDWRSSLLALITDPTVAYLLLLVGIYGLIFEFANPGGFAPGVVGAICLLIALYAFQLLPINYAGLALIVLGIAFMVAEALVPSFGALGIGGVAAFVAGSVMLLDADVPGFAIAWPLIATLAATSVVFFVVVAGMAARAWRRRVVSGAEELPDSRGEVLTDFEQGSGWVRVHGETWQGLCAAPLKRGQHVRVVSREGLRLTVEPDPPG